MPPRTRLSPEDRRAQLVDTAAQAFAARPYDEVRMDEVAQRAGVSRGLLYRHFPTKHDLFAAVYRRAAAAVPAWLTFVRTLCLEWFTSTELSRDGVRELCLGAQRGTLATAAPTLLI